MEKRMWLGKSKHVFRDINNHGYTVKIFSDGLIVKSKLDAESTFRNKQSLKVLCVTKVHGHWPRVSTQDGASSHMQNKRCRFSVKITADFWRSNFSLDQNILDYTVEVVLE